MPDRHSMTELHRSTVDGTGANVPSGWRVTADGAGGIAFVNPSAEGDSMVPYYIASGDTFTVPLYKQALFETAIEVDGTLTVDGMLIGVT